MNKSENINGAWKKIIVGLSIGLGTALVVALWTGSNRIASLAAGQIYITKTLDSLVEDVKQNRRLLFRTTLGRTQNND